MYPVDGDTVFISLKVDIIKQQFKNQVISKNYYYSQNYLVVKTEIYLNNNHIIELNYNAKSFAI